MRDKRLLPMKPFFVQTRQIWIRKKLKVEFILALKIKTLAFSQLQNFEDI